MISTCTLIQTDGGTAVPFAAIGVALLEGAANDYVGKGMSGGEIVGRLPRGSDERARK